MSVSYLHCQQKSRAEARPTGDTALEVGLQPDKAAYEMNIKLGPQFAPHDDRVMMPEAPLPFFILERPRATQILLSVLGDQLPHCHGTVGWRLGIGHPALNDLGKVVRRDVLDLQANFSKKPQEGTERERCDMGGVTQVLEAVLVGGTGGMFAYDQVFDGYPPLRGTDANHFP